MTDTQESEWQRQEAALRSDGDGEGDAAYVWLMRELARPQPQHLPADFAAQTAALAARERQTPSPWFEQLLPLLAALLLPLLAWLASRFNPQWPGVAFDTLNLLHAQGGGWWLWLAAALAAASLIPTFTTPRKLK
jgi:hypothetical protein